MNKLGMILGGLLAAAVVLGLSSAFVVDEREQALVVQFGQPKRTIVEPGLYFKTPFAERVIRIDKRILSLDVQPTEVMASDQRRIVVDSFARFRVTDALKMYQAARTEYGATNLLQTIMQSAVREVLAKQPMSAVVSGERAELMRQITDLTNEKASTTGLTIVDVRLKRVDLPTENSQAIFSRMRTEREREARAKRAQGREAAIEIRANADKEARVILANANRTSQLLRGEADAKAVKIFADAYKSDEEFFEFYRTLQAYRKSLGNNDTTLVLSPDSEFFKLFVSDAEK